jgi:hypothetical protein
MVCHSPPRLYLIGLWIEWSDSTDIQFSYTMTFWILIVLFLCTFVTGYGPVRGVDNFWGIPGVSNNNWSPTLRS